MKNTIKTILAGATLSLLLAGCEKEAEMPAGDRSIRIATGIPSPTKATDLDFEEGDNFGLFVVAWNGDAAPSLDDPRYLNNASCIKTAGGIELTKVYYPEGKSDFYAYYPYQSTFDAGTVLKHSVLADQSQGRNYTKSDLMAACRPGVTESETPVRLTFKHQLARIDIHLLPGTGFASADGLSGATVVAKSLKTSCSFDLSDNSVSDAGTPADMTPKGNGATVNGGTVSTMSLVAVPQTLAAGQLLFEITLGDKTFSYTPTEAVTLEQGKICRFDITLNKQVSAVSKAVISSLSM